ncbi:hypothetical protein ABZ942_15480 [Nocardia sp. NPDC046473]|uniref:hypothetical protein n=1 Tax=Nocardia sp. NPDC046473 TaxID=3155733 RepID=UPI0033CCD295
MTAAEVNHGAGVGEWMLEAFTRIKALHEQMDATGSAVEQQRLSDESAALAQPWESSRYAPQWRELWDHDSAQQSTIEGADVRVVSQRDRLAVALDEMTVERDELRKENTELVSDRAELAEQLAHALDERDRLRHLVHELEVEVDDALDIAGPHVLDASNERLAVPMTPLGTAPRACQQVVMQQ